MNRRIPPTSRSWVRNILVWGGLIGLFTYLAITTDLSGVKEAISLANPWLLAGLATIFTLLAFVTDSTGVHMLLHRCGFSPPFRKTIQLKGASYLLNIVNYNLGLAMMAALLSKGTITTLLNSAAPFILLLVVDLFVLSAQALAGLLWAGSPFGTGPTWILCTICIGGLLALPLARPILSIQRGPRWFLRLLRNPLFAALGQLRWKDLFPLVAIRTLLIAVYLFMSLSFLWAFDIRVPLQEMLVYAPIISLVGFIPISVSGIGSTQLVMRLFYAPFVAEGISAVAAIDASSTVMLLATLLIRIIVGLICVIRLFGIFKPRA